MEDRLRYISVERIVPILRLAAATEIGHSNMSQE